MHPRPCRKLRLKSRLQPAGQWAGPGERRVAGHSPACRRTDRAPHPGPGKAFGSRVIPLEAGPHPLHCRWGRQESVPATVFSGIPESGPGSANGSPLLSIAATTTDQCPLPSSREARPCLGTSGLGGPSGGESGESGSAPRVQSAPLDHEGWRAPQSLSSSPPSRGGPNAAPSPLVLWGGVSSAWLPLSQQGGAGRPLALSTVVRGEPGRPRFFPAPAYNNGVLPERRFDHERG